MVKTLKAKSSPELSPEAFVLDGNRQKRFVKLPVLEFD